MEKSHRAAGKFLVQNDEKYTVIGVVKDYHLQSIKPRNRAANIYHESQEMIMERLL